MKRKNYKVDAVTLRHNVGRRVRWYRDRESQREFAKQLGITQAYLCRLERGEVDVSLTFLQKMLAATKVSLSDFLKDIEDEDQDNIQGGNTT
jgi:transcriptional regulator with XRE-family HTH domain